MFEHIHFFFSLAGFWISRLLVICMLCHLCPPYLLFSSCFCLYSVCLSQAILFFINVIIIKLLIFFFNSCSFSWCFCFINACIVVLFWFLIYSLCFEISSSHLVVLSSCLSFHFTEFMFLLFSFNLYFSVKHSWRIFFCAVDYVFFKTGFFVFYAMLLVSVSLFWWVFVVLVCIVAILFFWLILSMSCTVLTFCLFSYVLERYPWFLLQLLLGVFFFPSELRFEVWILCMERVEGKSSSGAVYSLCCKNLAPLTLEILLKVPSQDSLHLIWVPLFSIAGTLSINIVLPIQLGALEPIQFMRVSSSVVYFPGFAHLTWANIFQSLHSQKERKNKDIPVSFQMCGYLWEFVGFGQFTSTTPAKLEGGGGTEGRLEAVLESYVSSLVVSLKFMPQAVFSLCLDAAGEVFANFF